MNPRGDDKSMHFFTALYHRTGHPFSLCAYYRDFVSVFAWLYMFGVLLRQDIPWETMEEEGTPNLVWRKSHLPLICDDAVWGWVDVALSSRMPVDVRVRQKLWLYPMCNVSAKSILGRPLVPYRMVAEIQYIQKKMLSSRMIPHFLFWHGLKFQTKRIYLKFRHELFI